MLAVHLGGDSTQGFLLSLPGSPGKRNLAWSDWLPREGRGGPPRSSGLNYRFKVQRWREPVRSQTVGHFTVQTLASRFYSTVVDSIPRTLTVARFHVLYDGQPVRLEGDTGSTSIDLDEVVRVAGSDPALLVRVDPYALSSGCYLLAPLATGVRVDSIANCSTVREAQLLTNDNARFHASHAVQVVEGRIDEVSVAEPGLYLIGSSTVLDTRARLLHPVTPDSALTPVPSVPPLGVSPDGRSIIRYGYGEGEDGIGAEERPRLGVTDFLSDRSYLVAIDPRRMRYATFEALDPEWIAHHFEWVRGSDGTDQLVERKHFVPIPYHGVVSRYDSGDRSYRIEKAGRELREELIAFLAKEFKGERMPADSDAYQVPVKVNGLEVQVAASSDFGYVEVSLPAGTGDTALVATIGERFNTALATGRYDSLFAPK
jgi:hypothetical protein